MNSNQQARQGTCLRVHFCDLSENYNGEFKEIIHIVQFVLFVVTVFCFLFACQIFKNNLETLQG